MKIEITYDSNGKVISDSVRILQGSKNIKILNIDAENFNIDLEIINEETKQFGVNITAVDKYDDTVKLEGKYFTPNVKTNDIVMPGDLLATIELDKIIEAGYDPTVMVIDTADSSKRNVTLLAKNTVHAKDDLVLIESI